MYIYILSKSAQFDLVTQTYFYTIMQYQIDLKVNENVNLIKSGLSIEEITIKST